MAAPAGPIVAIQAGFHPLAGRGVPKVLVGNRGLLARDFSIAVRSIDADLTAVAQAAHEFAGHPDAGHEANLVARLADWTGGLTLAPGQALLVAEADLSGGLPGRPRQADYSLAPRIAAHLARALGARFGQGLDLRLLYLTQAPVAWLGDLHWLLAKQANLTIPADRFRREAAALGDFDPVVTAIRQAVEPLVPGAKVLAVDVESLAAARLGPAEALFQLAGLKAAALAPLRPVPVPDPRPPYDLADAFVALNRANIPADALKRMKLALLASAELDRERDD